MKVARRQPRHDARRARNDVYRQHIFEAAEQVFAERGFEAATLQEIGKRVGLSMGTIYGIFPSKAELLQAILDARGQALLDLVRDVAGRRSDPGAALKALLEGYIDFFVGRPAFLRMHLRQGSSWILSPGNGSGGSRAEVWAEIHRLQADVFRRGIKDGCFVDEDPGLLSKLFSAFDQVVLSEWVAGGMKAPRDQLVQRFEAIVERTFCRKVSAKRARA
ncbi:MAG: TetR/AcrR family transcriptional regulator [Deltaproteobacteria bacterium]|nr:TetR/AcrR family transcriptional regulator [Deltaproteobacteria bacterium]